MHVSVAYFYPYYMSNETKDYFLCYMMIRPPHYPTPCRGVNVCVCVWGGGGGAVSWHISSFFRISERGGGGCPVNY